MKNIEMYTLQYIDEFEEIYKEYIKENKNKDVEYPNIDFKLKSEGKNVWLGEH